MKRTLAILIALAMSVMMLTACGSKDGTSGTPDNSGDANQTSTGSYPGNKNITLYCGYSAGGSSVLMLYICVGLVLSVYMHNTKSLFG